MNWKIVASTQIETQISLCKPIANNTTILPVQVKMKEAVYSRKSEFGIKIRQVTTLTFFRLATQTY